MPKHPLKSPKLYINRELSWLEFNDRVLREGLDEELPLLERLKFLAIVNSNLDEFFLVRVAWLSQQRQSGRRRRDPAGMTAAEQLAAVGSRVRRMVNEQAAGVQEVFARLAEHWAAGLGPATVDRGAPAALPPPISRRRSSRS